MFLILVTAIIFAVSGTLGFRATSLTAFMDLSQRPVGIVRSHPLLPSPLQPDTKRRYLVTFFALNILVAALSVVAVIVDSAEIASYYIIEKNASAWFQETWGTYVVVIWCDLVIFVFILFTSITAVALTSVNVCRGCPSRYRSTDDQKDSRNTNFKEPVIRSRNNFMLVDHVRKDKFDWDTGVTSNAVYSTDTATTMSSRISDSALSLALDGHLTQQHPSAPSLPSSLHEQDSVSVRSVADSVPGKLVIPCNETFH